MIQTAFEKDGFKNNFSRLSKFSVQEIKQHSTNILEQTSGQLTSSKVDNSAWFAKIHKKESASRLSGPNRPTMVLDIDQCNRHSLLRNIETEQSKGSDTIIGDLLVQVKTMMCKMDTQRMDRTNKGGETLVDCGKEASTNNMLPLITNYLNSLSFSDQRKTNPDFWSPKEAEAKWTSSQEEKGQQGSGGIGRLKSSDSRRLSCDIADLLQKLRAPSVENISVAECSDSLWESKTSQEIEIRISATVQEEDGGMYKPNPDFPKQRTRSHNTDQDKENLGDSYNPEMNVKQTRAAILKSKSSKNHPESSQPVLEPSRSHKPKQDNSSRRSPIATFENLRRQLKFVYGDSNLRLDQMLALTRSCLEVLDKSQDYTEGIGEDRKKGLVQFRERLDATSMVWHGDEENDSKQRKALEQYLIKTLKKDISTVILPLLRTFSNQSQKLSLADQQQNHVEVPYQVSNQRVQTTFFPVSGIQQLSQQIGLTANTDEYLPAQLVDKHKLAFKICAIAKQGNNIILGLEDGAITFVSVSSNGIVFERSLRYSTDPITNILPVTGLDGPMPDILFTSSNQKVPVILVWNLRTAKPVKKLAGHAGLITSTVNIEHRYLASASMDKNILFWDLLTFECVCSVSFHDSPILTMVYHSERNCLVSGDLSSNLVVSNISLDAGRLNDPHVLFKFKGVGPVMDLSVDREGRLVSYECSKIRVYDMRGALIWSISQQDHLSSVQFSNEDKLLCTDIHGTPYLYEYQRVLREGQLPNQGGKKRQLDDIELASQNISMKVNGCLTKSQMMISQKKLLVFSNCLAGTNLNLYSFQLSN